MELRSDCKCGKRYLFFFPEARIAKILRKSLTARDGKKLKKQDKKHIELVKAEAEDSGRIFVDATTFKEVYECECGEVFDLDGMVTRA